MSITMVRDGYELHTFPTLLLASVPLTSTRALNHVTRRDFGMAGREE
jgi:hypothetical protein